MAARGSSGSSGASKGRVIVPSYKEGPNIRPLVERVSKALAAENVKATITYVDDNSRDGSVETIEKLKSEGYNAEIIVRTKERGLSSAVVHGFNSVGGEFLVCMDGDLQHPPEKVPEMLKALETHDFVIGTRYGDGFNVDKDWPMHRKIISQGARMLARPLTPLSDPMSGFFGVRRDAFERGRKDLDTRGFKIAMEVYVKSRCSSHAEVPIFFGKRLEGESKLTGAVMIHYLLHLVALYRFRFPWLLPLLVLLAVAFLYFLVKLF
eukprot:CAMPEP_0175918310 /NCGR_PEP_ID=MMETSP0108-20121206/11813_1 /TAXON_ID=195067 ORGANISM="Goniomonas pacifica, Strain CCMP1869" /NCGR_SAMPLE_ID=MMETSP0108 /ASSEMBLY_ACC=CAM_ASM_000204 /LENGTH=264 /DNA_ID=CAMNT_0017240923 /DNA_START=1 /DNA_END=795 /DNA_ORIENTATION=-